MARIVLAFIDTSEADHAFSSPRPMKYDPDYHSALGTAVPEEESYLFGKPAWRKGVPLFLILMVWLPAAFLWKRDLVLPADPNHPVNAYTELILGWLASRGFGLWEAVAGAAVLSVPLLLWFYTGLERLVVTPTMIIRGYPLMPKRRIRWADLDEVLIDHLEARFEDETTARKTLVLYTRRGRFVPWRRRMRVNNRQFDGFEEVERIAVAVGVPAIADRIRQTIETTGKPARFPLRSLRERFAAGVFILAGVGLILASAYDPLWMRGMGADGIHRAEVEAAAPTGLRAWIGRIPNPLVLPGASRARPVLLGAGILLALAAVSRLWYQQIAVDYDNIYILRRGRVIRTIPLDSLADIQILGNVMRVYAYKRETDEQPRLIWKTRRFIRNRGVLLCLIRDIYDSRRAMDMTPITPMRSIPAPEEQSA